MTHPRESLLATAASCGKDILTQEFAQHMDEHDDLKAHREEFLIPKKNGKDVVYMCGNSLGLQHKGVRASMEQMLDKWGTVAVEGHFVQPVPWFEIDEFLQEPMAKVVGAERSEVAIMNTLTVNLHLLMTAFYKPEGKRRKILIEKNPFPSDMYAVCSQIRLKGGNPEEDLLEVGLQDEVRCFDEKMLLDLIEEKGDEIAMIMLGGVHFLTGQFFDIEKITAAGKAKGCVVGWDLAHAAGNCVLKLHDWKVDFACWCTYKYINSGPGNIAGAFIHKDIDCSSLNRLEGWWGHKRESRFQLKHDFDGTEGVASFQLSNPGVVNMAALRPGLELMAEIGVDKLRAKSLLLTGYVIMRLWFFFWGGER